MTNKTYYMENMENNKSNLFSRNLKSFLKPLVSLSFILAYIGPLFTKHMFDRDALICKFKKLQWDANPIRCVNMEKKFKKKMYRKQPQISILLCQNAIKKMLRRKLCKYDPKKN